MQLKEMREREALRGRERHRVGERHGMEREGEGEKGRERSIGECEM